MSRQSRARRRRGRARCARPVQEDIWCQAALRRAGRRVYTSGWIRPERDLRISLPRTTPAEFGRTIVLSPLITVVEQGARDCRTNRRYQGAEQRRGIKPANEQHDIIGNLAELWRKDYVDNPKVKLAKPTRDKYNNRLDCHILPRWKDKRLSDLNDSKAVLDWLQERSSYYMMLDLRNIMCGMITRAKEWSIIPRSYANPMEWVKVGKQPARTGASMRLVPSS